MDVELWIGLLVGLVETAVCYGIIPMLIICFAKNIDQKTYKTICIIITVIIAVAFFVVASLTDEASRWTALPAILWGGVFYKIGAGIIEKRKMRDKLPQEMKKEVTATHDEAKRYEQFIVDKETGEVIETVETDVSQDQAFTKRDNVQQSNRKRVYTSLEIPVKTEHSRTAAILATCLFILSAALAGLSIYEETQLRAANEKLEETQTELAEAKSAILDTSGRIIALTKENKSLKEKADCLDDNFVFYIGGDDYHMFDCPVMAAEKTSAGMIAIHRFDLRTAFDGFDHPVTPCPTCHPAGVADTIIIK